MKRWQRPPREKFSTFHRRSYWIPGSYAPALAEKRLRLSKNKNFQEEDMSRVGWYAIGTSTTLESNKSLPSMLGCGVIGLVFCSRA